MKTLNADRDHLQTENNKLRESLEEQEHKAVQMKGALGKPQVKTEQLGKDMDNLEVERTHLAIENRKLILEKDQLQGKRDCLKEEINEMKNLNMKFELTQQSQDDDDESVQNPS